MLYVILLSTVLCFFIEVSSEKNTASLINSISIEIKNPGHVTAITGTAETVSIPAVNAANKLSIIRAIGVGKKTLLIKISPEKAKNKSFADYSMDESASSHNSSSDYNSTFIDSDLSALTVNKTFAHVGLSENDNIHKSCGFLAYETAVTSILEIRLVNPIMAGLPIAISTKDYRSPFGVLSPGNSWTHSGINKTTSASDYMSSDSSSDSSSNIVNVTGTAYDQVSPQSSRLNTYKYRVLQPVSPPIKYHSSNTSYPGESSHFVGADGHTITLVNNESAVDPSYEQLVEFIKRDKTNEIPYNKTSFVCSDAAERVHNNAETFGFRCAWVYINFENENATINPATNALVVGHACNLFNITDKGLVAIDCTGGSRPADAAASVDLSMWDNEVPLVKGGEYIPKLLYSFPGSDNMKPFSSMGTIADFYVFW